VVCCFCFKHISGLGIYINLHESHFRQLRKQPCINYFFLILWLLISFHTTTVGQFQLRVIGALENLLRPRSPSVSCAGKRSEYYIFTSNLHEPSPGIWFLMYMMTHELTFRLNEDTLLSISNWFIMLMMTVIIFCLFAALWPWMITLNHYRNMCGRNM
jgi:hypothetical protein